MRALRSVPLSALLVALLMGCGNPPPPPQGAAPKLKQGTEVAQRVLKGVLAGDVQPLYSSLTEREIKEGGLTPESVRGIYEEVVRPILDKGKPEGPILLGEEPSTLMSMATQAFRGPGKVPGAVGVDAFYADDGPKTSFSSLLQVVWMLDATYRKGSSIGGNEKRQAVLDGLRRDRAKLDRWGLKALVPIEPTRSAYSLDEYERRLAAKLKAK